MHGGNLEFFAPRYGFRIDQMIDFSANINPFGPPPEAQDILELSLKEISRYPDPEFANLRGTLAKWHKVEPENLTVANGASELIYWVPRLLSSPKTLIFAPTFSEYSNAVLSAGGTVEYDIAKENDQFHHFFTNYSSNGVNLIFVNNPNNPTGNLYTRSTLENWINQYSQNNPAALFIIDESFLPFVKEEENYSLVPFAIYNPQVIILRSLTKMFSIPGLRLGYVIGNVNTVKKLENVMPTWRVNIIAQRFGEKIFSYSKFLQNSADSIRAIRKDLIEKLRKIPQIKVFDSSANFLLLKIKDEQMSASKLSEQLAEKGILVRYCDDFYGLESDRFVRIAVRKMEENIHLINTLMVIFGHAG